MIRKLLTGAAVAAAVVATAVSPAAAAPPAKPPANLATAVADSVLARAGKSATAPLVTTTREAGGWAFGTAVVPTGHGKDDHPDGWLFVAERAGGQWRVALEGEASFAELTGRAPVVAAEERGRLAELDGRPETKAGNDFRTGMALPYAVGQSWYMYGGPHGWAGTPTPWSSLDLAGGDQRVLAARAGTAYTMCTGWLRVIHDRGYSTDYYHLWNNIWVDGAAVSQGTFLGNTGTDVTCGGSANGRHVHFALRQNSAYVGIADHGIGKWVPQNGGAAYQGSALHGSTRVGAGGTLYNYGALGFTQGVIDSNGGGAVNKRSGPGTGLVGSVADGTTVSVSCSANGTSHTGRWGTTSLWNRLTDGTWVTDAFMWTGVNGAVNGTC